MPISIAVIGGSAAHDLLAQGLIQGERLGEIETPFGPSQPIYRVRADDLEFLFLPRHGEEGYRITAPFVNYRANIYALKEHEVERILAWSGPGAIDPSLKIGQLVVPDDLIDETKNRPTTFFQHGKFGFLRQHPVFCPQLRTALLGALERLGLGARDAGTCGATYVCTEGPRLETAAEIRKFQTFGAQLVGMTLAPECFLARELEICYAPICYVTNYAEGLALSRAEGVREAEFRPGVLFEGLLDESEQGKIEAAVRQFPAIIQQTLQAIRESPRNCPCAQAMQRYRKQGNLPDDWHDWL